MADRVHLPISSEEFASAISKTLKAAGRARHGKIGNKISAPKMGNHLHRVQVLQSAEVSTPWR